MPSIILEYPNWVQESDWTRDAQVEYLGSKDEYVWMSVLDHSLLLAKACMDGADWCQDRPTFIPSSTEDAYSVLTVNEYQQLLDRQPDSDSLVFLDATKKGAFAAARVWEGYAMTILRGSTMVDEEAHSLDDESRRARRHVVENGFVIRQGESFVFRKQYEFSCPSVAAKVIAGYRIDGYKHGWTDRRGRCLEKIGITPSK